MSWNGTVRCSHCYSTGHNKRSCPEYTERMKKNALQEIEAGEGYDGYWNRQYNKRVKDGLYADGTPMSEAHKAAGAKAGGRERRCTYCGAKGHNRRTCTVLAANKAEYIEKNIAFRKRVLGAMKAEGLGIGALLKQERWGDTYAWMVTKINWNGITEGRFGHQDLVMAQNLKTDGVARHNQTQWMCFPSLTDEDGVTINEPHRGMSELVGPVVLAGVPDNFLTEAGLAAMRDDHFDKDARSANYWDNYYDRS